MIMLGNHNSRIIGLWLVLFLLVSCATSQQSPTSQQVTVTQVPPTSIILPTSATPSLTERISTQAITVAPEVSTWLRENAIPFDTTDPNSDFEDLMPLKKLIGDARIVALGEATHGTHEFFQMKYRLVKFLVEEMGFNIFAIEANWPEANLVNNYVQTGRGDPAELLKGLYFWTWDTQEVLDMIRWMRTHNENPGQAPLINFYGFDMQFYKVAMDNVTDYLKKVDADSATQADKLYRCFRQYSDREVIYAQLSAEKRSACEADLQAVYDQLSERQSTYEIRSSSTQFALALQNARLVLQAEQMYGAGDAGYMLRDRYMADNVAWLLSQGGPNAKIILWAHNGHVSTDASNPKPMGAYLRERYGAQMVVFGFSFFQGSFNAVNISEAGNAAGGIRALSVALPPEDSYEYYFQSAKIPRFFLDLRNLPSTLPTTEWLLVSHPFRSIGSAYKPSSPEEFFSSVILPQTFDIIIYFQDTSPSILLNR
jgi:erythromycin esterase